MAVVEAGELAAFLARHPPFDALGPEQLDAVVRGLRVEHFAGGALVHDAFAEPTDEVFVVLTGQVDLLWDAAHPHAPERLGPGAAFGFSAMLSERPVGPRAVAAGAATVARIPEALAAPAFATRSGARLLAEAGTAGRRGGAALATYSGVDDLVTRPPLVVDAGTPVGEVARRMTELGVPAAVVRTAEGGLGLVTDTLLRARVLAAGRDEATPAGEVMDAPAPTVAAGASAAEALMLLLDRDAEFLLVTDRAGELCGLVCPRDFAISSITVGVSLQERLRRAGGIDELARHAAGVPPVLADLLAHGLTPGRVVAVYSSFLDTIVRRAIGLVFARHPELSVDAFTWLSLGSNGRREAVLSSDVDSAVAFPDDVDPAAVPAYRDAFAEVSGVLDAAGLSTDGHGTTAQNPAFSRTHAQWRAAGREWLAAPERHDGAIMTSMLVDGRPIHGDPGLPAVVRVVGDLRTHPGTLRLLLQETLSRRARMRPSWFPVRPETLDVKTHALRPMVNLARWAALGVGSAALPTTERLRAASGSAMLPTEAADTLVEVFDVLQGLRLRHQLAQYRAGERPSDVLTLAQLSPIDRSVVAQAVREIAAAQRRMDNVSHFVEIEDWVSPA